MQRHHLHCARLGAWAVLSACGGEAVSPADSRTNRPPLFPEPTECVGDAIVRGQADATLVMSELHIAPTDQGDDLDHDGQPDNKFGSLAVAADAGLVQAFADFSIILPIELFDISATDTSAGVADPCVKVALYNGLGSIDTDNDQSWTMRTLGDCHDAAASANHLATELVGNRIDDDCDGLADEGPDDAPSIDAADEDGDGMSLAAGDCDDSSSGADHSPSRPEVCGDGRDNDCDGRADVGATAPTCNILDGTGDYAIAVAPESVDVSGQPQIRFISGAVDAAGRLEAGPARFRVKVPITDTAALDLGLTGATLSGRLVAAGTSQLGITDGKVTGIVSARDADTVFGLDFPQYGITPDRSLADAIFTNILGVFLGLVENSPADMVCRQPDIDVDGDGLERFCDTSPTDAVSQIDLCIDGDGTQIASTPGARCTTATDANGQLRFADGISAAFLFAAVPARLE